MSTLARLANNRTMDPWLRKASVVEIRRAIKVEKATRKRARVLARLAGRLKRLLGEEVDREVFSR